MPMFSKRIGMSKFICYDIMRRIQKMGADVQEELTDMTHKFLMFAVHESGDISDIVYFPKLSLRNTCKFYKILNCVVNARSLLFIS